MPWNRAARLQPAAMQQPLLEQAPRGRRARLDTGIERRFDVPFVARLALKEKQIQQNVRPVIAVHKWFARRPGSLFRALLLAEFADGPLSEAYYATHRFDGLRIADPFMGGGSPLLEANRLGCDVAGWDVNPMAWWIVRQEIASLDLESYLEGARAIGESLALEVGDLYRTRCNACGGAAEVKYFIWVKTRPCDGCGQSIDLFPGYLLAAAERHPRNVLICAACGGLTEVEDRRRLGDCAHCRSPLLLDGPAGRGRCLCPGCGAMNVYPRSGVGPPDHRLAALEYHCRGCAPRHRGRFFKAPDREDFDRLGEAERRLRSADLSLVPTDPIPPGDETDRLHRWGYRRFRELFNPRQLLGLANLAARIAAVEAPALREALATNLSDLLRYQNMLCRYDTRSLKSLDIFSVHGFPVGLVQCESNLLGIRSGGDESASVGSGGWSNIVDKFVRAKRYCAEPFEIRYGDRGKQVVAMPGEWIGDRRNGDRTIERRVEIHCGSAAEAELPPASLDAVLTDPPYFANVQYAELMEFCHVWLRKLAGADDGVFAETTRRSGDLTGNATLDRGLEHFTEGLSGVFRRFASALKPGRPFVFTYHHNSLDAYYPVAVALLDAGLACTAALPCPAEMCGSIHIHKSGSSIVDTVFVCRSPGAIPTGLHTGGDVELPALVAADVEALRSAGVAVTRGDARCVSYGHLIRLAVRRLRGGWDADTAWVEKLSRVEEEVSRLPGWEEMVPRLEEERSLATRRDRHTVARPEPQDGVKTTVASDRERRQPE